MKHTGMLALKISMVALLFASVCIAQGGRKGADQTQSIVILPFESSVKGASGLPEATRTAIIQMIKDEALFAAVLTPEEAKDKDKATMLELSARLVDFEPGNAAKRVLVGFGGGRAHAGFEFVIKDSKGELWKKTLKSNASFWFNGTTSSAAERAELPEGVAKKLIEELKKRNR